MNHSLHTAIHERPEAQPQHASIPPGLTVSTSAAENPIHPGGSDPYMPKPDNPGQYARSAPSTTPSK